LGIAGIGNVFAQGVCDIFDETYLCNYGWSRDCAKKIFLRKNDWSYWWAQMAKCGCDKKTIYEK
jgi:hypothetical protein